VQERDYTQTIDKHACSKAWKGKKRMIPLARGNLRAKVEGKASRCEYGHKMTHPKTEIFLQGRNFIYSEKSSKESSWTKRPEKVQQNGGNSAVEVKVPATCQ